MQTFFDALRQVFTVRVSIFCVLKSILAGIASILQLLIWTLITKLDAFEGVSKFPTAILRLKKMLIKAKVSHPEKFIHKFNVDVLSQCKLDAKS